MAVPSDYRWLVSVYGPETFDDFLHVLQPKSRFPAIRFTSFAQSYRVRLSARVASGRSLPYPPESLLPVARTEDGDVISWVMGPEEWTLTVNNASRTDWLDFPGGIVDFLGAVYADGFRMPFFPDDFPSAEPRFRPHPSVEGLEAEMRGV